MRRLSISLKKAARTWMLQTTSHGSMQPSSLRGYPFCRNLWRKSHRHLSEILKEEALEPLCAKLLESASIDLRLAVELVHAPCTGARAQIRGHVQEGEEEHFFLCFWATKGVTSSSISGSVPLGLPAVM
mmetsp:Transcript_46429/g.86789  ORF Transcript_46429/g.86789 Transcript_46429/m.86789 type:complete len:129 (-) Transcript_46429:105-491(-)